MGRRAKKIFAALDATDDSVRARSLARAERRRRTAADPVDRGPWPVEACAVLRLLQCEAPGFFSDFEIYTADDRREAARVSYHKV